MSSISLMTFSLSFLLANDALPISVVLGERSIHLDSERGSFLRNQNGVCSHALGLEDASMNSCITNGQVYMLMRCIMGIRVTNSSRLSRRLPHHVR
ncbi:hypothetical protein F5879DRAFT_974270 [Lentinula edodes]|nr:hypothetical protein F5879DRAFT_974270 [Lentinula edodes]